MTQLTDLTIISWEPSLPGFCTQWHIACFNPGGTCCRSFVTMGAEQPETIAAIVAAHRAGTLTPAQTVARTYQRIRDHNDPAVFISLRDEKDALAEAEGLTKK